MKKLLFCLFLFITAFIHAQNDECSGATSLNVGTDFASGAITSTNVNATTDGFLPSCNSNAIDNVWFTAVVPASGNLKIEARTTPNSPFYNPVLTVYGGTCGSLTEINCSDDIYSPIVLTGQTPGTTLYVSVWKFDSYSGNGEFKISAYDPIPPANDDCSQAISLTVGTNFNSGAITSSNSEATTDGSLPSCNTNVSDNVWFTAVVPASGNLRIEAQTAPGIPSFHPVITVYEGTCSSLTEINCSDNIYSPIILTGQTPGTTFYISVWKNDLYSDNGEFRIAAYDPILPTNDDCLQATSLTIGTNFASGAITSNNVNATTNGPLPSCNPNAVDNLWFTAVVPASGNLNIEVRKSFNSPFYAPLMTVYEGTCGSLTEIYCNIDNPNINPNIYPSIALTGQTPGTIFYISVWKYTSYISNGEFQISAYDPIPPANDDCTQATPLTVGTNFSSGAITSTNSAATKDGTPPSCSPYSTDNVWFTAVIPASGNLNIEVQKISNSPFNSLALNVYQGSCGSLTEIDCMYNASPSINTSVIFLTGQTPGATLYISVWKYIPYSGNGEFQISAYDPIPPANDDCSQATPLTVGTDFSSGAITSNNSSAFTDGPVPSCATDAADNVWFTATVPESGNLKIEFQHSPNSPFEASVLTVYEGICGSLAEIDCLYNFIPNINPLMTLTGQIPGSTLYISVWKLNPYVSNGEFRISAYDDTVLSTHEASKNSKKIQVSPNPFSDVLTISDISEIKSISVINASGRLVKTIKTPSSSLQLGDLKEGIYLLLLHLNDGTTKTIKTIKK